jgi:hypothetical protein
MEFAKNEGVLFFDVCVHPAESGRAPPGQVYRPGGFEFTAIDQVSGEFLGQVRRSSSSTDVVQFLHYAFAHYRRLGISVRCVCIDASAPMRSAEFLAACEQLGMSVMCGAPHSIRSITASRRMRRSQ